MWLNMLFHRPTQKLGLTTFTVLAFAIIFSSFPTANAQSKTPRTYELRCMPAHAGNRDSVDMYFMIRREGIFVRFSRGAEENTAQRKPPKAGECRWRDRRVRDTEPTVIIVPWTSEEEFQSIRGKLILAGTKFYGQGGQSRGVRSWQTITLDSSAFHRTKADFNLHATYIIGAIISGEPFGMQVFTEETEESGRRLRFVSW
ncbi:MAG: hypothetical protein AAF996_03155 [Pseudomonadota bacterium]